MDGIPPRLWFVISLVLGIGWVSCRLRLGILRRRYVEVDRRVVGNNLRLKYAMRGIVLAFVLTAAAMIRFGWSFAIAWLVAINVAALAFYGWDKLSAMFAAFRVPEATLHVLALVGGSVGALVGQDVFRHKISSEKKGFRATLWGIIALQLGAVALSIRSGSNAG